MQRTANSKITPQEIKYPEVKARRCGYMNVSKSPGHTIYWEEYGNPKGEPVMVLHGGPGAGSDPSMARFFDPVRYRVILFDQRGCGKSLPNAADQPSFALQGNTTQDLIADIDKLRQERGISIPMHVFGGSWGSTLALAYAEAHPESVRDLILRGIFLNRKQDLDYFYQGNAADLGNHEITGAYKAYETLPTTPEVKAVLKKAWQEYVEFIPAEKRGDMVKAYAEIFAHNPITQQEREHQDTALKLWTVWEGVASYLVPDLSNLGKFDDLSFARTFARIENHYFMNGAFLGGAGEGNRNQNDLLEHVSRIKDKPVYIVQGEHDLVCPKFQADDLVEALKRAGASQVDYRVVPAGHSMMEREIHKALTSVMDGLPKMEKELLESGFAEREADRISGSKGHERG